MKISMNENRTVTGTGAPVTPRQILETRVESAPDSVAFQYIKKKQTVSVTCGQFWREVNAMGVFFYRHGLYGKRIAVLGENSYEWILTWFAVVLSGNVVVPLDKDQRPEELAELLSRCEAEALVCSGQYYDVAETLHAADAVKRVLSMEDIPLILEHSSGLLDECGIETSGDTVCTIIFTSGTTGEQKGVMLTRRNLASDAFNASRSLGVKGSSVLTLPLHHTFGFTVGVLAAYLCGYPICISKSLRTFNKDLQSFAPVNLVLVPLYVETMYKAVWKTAREQGMEKKLRRMIAYSSVAQIGYIYLGIAVGTEAGIAAAVFHMIAHALAKSLLFLTGDRLIGASDGDAHFHELRGAAFRAPVCGAAFTVGALSIVGVPLFAGFASKLYLCRACLDMSNRWAVVGLMVLAVSTALNAAYFIITIVTLYRTPTHEYTTRMHHHWYSTAALAAIAVLLVLVGLLAPQLYGVIQAGIGVLA